MLSLARGVVGALLLLLATSFFHDWTTFPDSSGISDHIAQVESHSITYQLLPRNNATQKQRKILTKVEGLELFLHTAFLDNRYKGTVVRILGMQHITEQWESLQLSCIIFHGNTVVGKTIAKRYFIDRTWPWWGYHYGIMIDCSFPIIHQADSVLLASYNSSHYKFKLNIENTNTTRKQDLAVCVKPAYGNLKVSRLVEWFEMFRLLGITNFILYDSEIQGPSRYVLDYYKNQGVLTVFPFPFTTAIRHNVKVLHPEYTPGKFSALDQQSYLVAMQDCLYRYHQTFSHLLFVDLDELVLPTHHLTLPQLVSYLDGRYVKAAGYMFLTSWHFEELGELLDMPSYLYLQRFGRGTIPALNQPKSIVRTDRTISVNFHSVLDVPETGYSNEEMPWQDTAYVAHFRGTCKSKFDAAECSTLLQPNNTFEDTNLRSYINALNTNVKKILTFLDIGE